MLEFDVEADLTYQQAIFDLGVGYRTKIGNKDNPQEKPDAFFDIIAGLRVQYLKQSLDIDIETENPNDDLEFDTDLGQDETWVEPLLSARIFYNISNKVGLGSRFDISGFGIDELSLTWRVNTGIDWMFAKNTSFKAGYSVFGIDYETGEGEDEFGLDQLQHGPFIAFTFRF